MRASSNGLSYVELLPAVKDDFVLLVACFFNSKISAFMVMLDLTKDSIASIPVSGAKK